MVVLNSFIMWLHLLAAVIWVGGGLVQWLVTMPSLAAIDPPPMRGKFMGVLLQRQGMIVWSAIAVLALTGIYQLVTKISSASVLVSTSYGIALLIKLVLVAVMIGLAAYLGLVLSPKMAAPPPAPIAGGAGGPSGPPPHVARLQAQILAVAKTNIVVGLLVLGAVAVMRSV